jgi:hypothetical protein
MCSHMAQGSESKSHPRPCEPSYGDRLTTSPQLALYELFHEAQSPPAGPIRCLSVHFLDTQPVLAFIPVTYSRSGMKATRVSGPSGPVAAS